MDGSVTISVEDFEQLRRCEKVYHKMYKALSKCDFADDGSGNVRYNEVMEAIAAMYEV